ncbi:MAG: glutaredoxin 3 [Candidatus Thiodiazotropha sp.]|nr:glutaredoxin 3 [Candidatus Thiodiazotropha sp.]MCM8884573.1 glutaredoxin 3 [Candidatus Thiodiazotropha sp.]MCM8921387.1 glutaredoxin 3 [Candidatus Thiodiazotropha sp.]MCU7872922.1 glutaredoxin 3 [Candidatus Thiodiazotropha sp. (ex Lucinoma borealis)]
MNNVEIYTTSQCPYCINAKALLDARNIAYEEFKIGSDQQVLSEMVNRTGGRTVPQIVINDQAIGGFDDLRQLDLTGHLASLLETH